MWTEKKGSDIGCSIYLKKTKESLNLTKVGKTQIVIPLDHKKWNDPYIYTKITFTEKQPGH